jgi:ribosomal protein S6E (S10)
LTALLKQQDALLDRDAAIKEAAMLRDIDTGEVNPLAERTVQSEADRRALEGMKSFERLSKQNTVKISGGNAGKGTPMGDAKDVAMRKVANAAIVELQDTTETITDYNC